MRRFLVTGLCLVLASIAAACATTAASPSSSSSVAASSSSQPTAAGPQHIVLNEWHVAVANALKAGKLTFVITNTGSVEHELLVFKSDLAPSAYPKDSAGDMNEKGKGITQVSDGPNIAPGASQTRTIDLSKPGKYLFVCNIPGHFHSGMFTVVTVTP